MNCSHVVTAICGRAYAHLELTYNCNFNCQFCCVPWIDHPQIMGNELSCEDWCRIIDILVSNGVNRITLSGGEPLLRTDLPDIIKHIKKEPKILGCTVYTNISMVSREIYSLIDDERFEVFTSLQGIKTRSKMIGGRSSLWRFKRSCQKVARSKASLLIGITVTKVNLFEVEDMISLADRLGATVIQVGVVMVEGRAKDHHELWLTYPEICSLANRLESVRKKIDAKLIVVQELRCHCRPDSVLPDDIPPGYQEAPCNIDKTLFVIGPDGRQRRCVHTWDIGGAILPGHV